jgi:hypothetical protein
VATARAEKHTVSFVDFGVVSADIWFTFGDVAGQGKLTTVSCSTSWADVAGLAYIWQVELAAFTLHKHDHPSGTAAGRSSG